MILSCLTLGILAVLTPTPAAAAPPEHPGKGKSSPKACALEPGDVICPPCTVWHRVRCECVKVPPSKCQL
jgi:hypothetical protein